MKLFVITERNIIHTSKYIQHTFKLCILPSHHCWRQILPFLREALLIMQYSLCHFNCSLCHSSIPCFFPLRFFYFYLFNLLSFIRYLLLSHRFRYLFFIFFIFGQIMFIFLLFIYTFLSVFSCTLFSLRHYRKKIHNTLVISRVPGRQTQHPRYMW